MATDDAEQEATAKHRGHTIKVIATRVEAGRWSWGYLIDKRIDGRGRITLATPEAALRMGMSAAKARAEEL
jgi:hypothetical protein